MGRASSIAGPTPGHFMMRVRMPNGIVTAAQARLLGEITKESGREHRRRHHPPAGPASLARPSRACPRSSRASRRPGSRACRRGWTTSAASSAARPPGSRPSELFDTAPIAREFQRIFVGNKAFTNLPRKFNVTITGCPEHCTSGETQDISMTPAIASLEGERGRRLQPGRRRQAGLGRTRLRHAARRLRPSRGGGRGLARRSR